jgi:hypothetical protein
MNNRRMALLPNNKSQQKKLVAEIKLLIACSLFRLVFDFIFYVATPTYYRIISFKGEDCLHSSYFFSIGYLLIGSHMSHHVPIVIVTNIFKPKNDASSILDLNSSFGEQVSFQTN